jgi:hypothetical protein
MDMTLASCFYFWRWLHKDNELEKPDKDGFVKTAKNEVVPAVSPRRVGRMATLAVGNRDSCVLDVQRASVGWWG